MGMGLKKKAVLFLAVVVLSGTMGCYQIHSDDDLRTIPVTNNPHVVPKSSTQGIPTPKI